jgi:anaerobic selenocysteine-containing dehydrogenase
MAPHSNLAEHLIECLNVVCGRYARVGDQVPNPGVISARYPKTAEVIPAQRWWEQGYKSRIGGYGTINGELMAAILADEILTPGPGQVRCLFAHGSNLVNIMPDQRKTIAALQSLELLVSVEPYMNETAKMSHYVLPTTLQYERPDLSHFLYEQSLIHKPYVRYTPAIAKPPRDSDVVDDWYIFWELAKRLRLQLRVDEVDLDMTRAPSTDDVLAIIARRMPMPLDELKTHERGKLFDEQPQFVEPGDPASTGRFTTLPQDVAGELAAVACESIEPGHSISQGQRFSHRLSSRRVREVHNSTGRSIPAVRHRMPYNPAYMHPDELITLGVKAGDKITITSDRGQIAAIVKDDATVRRGVVSITHAWGGLPWDTEYERDGVNTNILISTDRDLERINAMPRMSAIPVNVAPLK